MAILVPVKRNRGILTSERAWERGCLNLSISSSFGISIDILDRIRYNYTLCVISKNNYNW